jgi:hypothetical protein
MDCSTSKCKDCSGSAIFGHSHQTHLWKDCSGSSICEHSNQKNQCTIAPCTGKSTKDRKLDKNYALLMTATAQQRVALGALNSDQ